MTKYSLVLAIALSAFIFALPADIARAQDSESVSDYTQENDFSAEISVTEAQDSPESNVMDEVFVNVTDENQNDAVDGVIVPSPTSPVYSGAVTNIDSASSEPPVSELENAPAQDANVAASDLDLNLDIAPPKNDIDENLYFDAESYLPESQLSTAVPRRVNPQTEPASSIIVVGKDHDANSATARLVAAERAIALGRYEAALDIYIQLEETYPSGPKTLLGKAVALQHLGRDDEAIATYQRLLDKNPDNIDAHINMLGLVSQKYPAVALQRLQALREKNPSNREIVGQMAYVQAQIGRYEEALKNFAFLASFESRNASHILNMAIVADKAGMKKQAIEYYERALELDTIYGGGRSISREEVFDRLARLR